MARAPTALKSHLQPLELRERYRRCRVLKEARRWHALWLLSQGHRAAHVAQTLGMSPAWVRHVRQGYNTRGPEAVPEGHQRNPGGRRLRLSAQQRRQLSKRLERAPQDGGIWTGAKVAAWMEQHTGQKTYPQLGCTYLHRVGFSPQVPRRRHAQGASPAQQRAFKKSSGVRCAPCGRPIPAPRARSGPLTTPGAASSPSSGASGRGVGSVRWP